MSFTGSAEVDVVRAATQWLFDNDKRYSMIGVTRHDYLGWGDEDGSSCCELHLLYHQADG